MKSLPWKEFAGACLTRTRSVATFARPRALVRVWRSTKDGVTVFGAGSEIFDRKHVEAFGAATKAGIEPSAGPEDDTQG
jgi:hypothetical protein